MGDFAVGGKRVVVAALRFAKRNRGGVLLEVAEFVMDDPRMTLHDFVEQVVEAPADLGATVLIQLPVGNWIRRDPRPRPGTARQ